MGKLCKKVVGLLMSLLVLLVLAPTLPALAAEPANVIVYDLGHPSAPIDITIGPDGDVWYTDFPGVDPVGKLIPENGIIYSFELRSMNTGYIAEGDPRSIATGPDGNLWIAKGSANQIGKFTTTGDLTEYNIPTFNSQPFDIAAGSDGNLWFTESAGNKIGKVTTAGVITEYAIPTSSSQPRIITAGTGCMWFTEYGGNQIGKITFDGTITEYPIPTAGSQPFGIAVGPDENIWFTEGAGNKIGVLNPSEGTITEYTVPTLGSQPQGITTGSDGNLWFTEYSGNKIGKITPVGTITEYAIPTPGGSPMNITADENGNLYFTEYDGKKIGKITVDGIITEYTTPNEIYPTEIVAGPDGRMWFIKASGFGAITKEGIYDINAGFDYSSNHFTSITVGPDDNLWIAAAESFGYSIDRIVKYNINTGFNTDYDVPTAYCGVNNITVGPDGNLWFNESDSNKIGRITPGGTITEYAIPTPGTYAQGIAAGPDGCVWFTETLKNKIGKITTDGVVTEYPIPTSGQPIGIVAGPDGNLWFTEFSGNKIGRITPGGVITEYPLPASAGPYGIAVGPDGNLWFAAQHTKNIGRITTEGAITLYDTPAGGSGPRYITAGVDGYMWFTESSAGKIGKIPVPVANLASTGATGTTASFSWKAATGASAVTLQQSTNGTDWTDADTGGTLAANAASATATGLSSGVTYQFRLRVTGGANDGVSNIVSVTTGAATAVTLLSAVADGALGVLTSTKIDLFFDTPITGLTANDITITDGTGAAVKGALTGSGTSWSVALSSVAVQGDVSVAVSSPAGYILSGSPKTVAVYKAILPTPVMWLTAAADGAVDTVTSTKIDLTFDTPITGLTADHITIADGTGAAVKGVLTGSGTSWSVALSSVAVQGDVSVAVSSPAGYILSGSPKTVAVNKAILPTPVMWLTAAADGAVDTVTSTKIDLAFDTPITGLTADHITITDGTGAAVKGALTGSGTSWSVALSSVAVQGDVSVAVSSPAGYILSGSPKTVAVYKAAQPSGTPPLIQTETLAGGTVSAAYSQTLAALGDTPVTWTVESGSLPDGLALSGDTIAGTPVLAGTFSFTVKAQNGAGSDMKALSITVTPAFYTITAAAGPGGSISPSGPVSVASGGSQTFTVTADAGFAIASVTVDGVDQGPVSAYTFTAASADHTIQAAFAADGTDDFAFGTLMTEVSSFLISAQGLLKPSATLNVTLLADGDSIREELEAMLSGKEVITAFEISIDPSDAFLPPLSISFQIGDRHNGRTVYILHRLHSGSVEQFTPVVANGTAVITVTELSPFLIAANPWIVITAQPQNVTVVKGQTATFFVTAQGETPLSYQWQKKTGPNAAWQDIAGAVNPMHTTPQTNLSNSGFGYRAVITDTMGNSVVSDAATLMVIQSPDTGDDSQPVLYMALMLLFLASAILLLRKRKTV